MSFDSALHPRDPHGRFARKTAKIAARRGKVSISAHEGPGLSTGAKIKTGLLTSTEIGIRLSHRSVTGTIGRSFPIIPGRIRGHIGLLGRIEHISQKKSFIERGIHKAIGSVRNETIRSILNAKPTQIGSSRINLSGPRIVAPQLRVSRKLGPKVSRRKPRIPRQPRVKR